MAGAQNPSRAFDQFHEVDRSKWMRSSPRFQKVVLFHDVSPTRPLYVSFQISKLGISIGLSVQEVAVVLDLESC